MVLTLNDSEEAVGSDQGDTLKQKQQQNNSFKPIQEKPEQKSTFRQTNNIKTQHKLLFFKRLLFFFRFSKKKN